MKLKTLILVGGLLLALIVTISSLVVSHLFRTSPTVARRVNSPMPVRVVSAKQANLTEILGATGEIQPVALVDLTATVHTRVERVAVDLGDLISVGQVLIQFDRELLKAVLTTARSTLNQASGDLNRADHNLRRIRTIYEQGLLPKIEVEKAQAALEEARKNHSEAKEKLLRAKKDLQNATIVSPVLGIVMERFVNPGETPQSDQSLFTIGRIDPVLIEAKIAEERVGDIHLQQSATVTFNAFPNDVLEGEVVKIKPVTNPETKTFLVYVKLPNPDLKLKPGLTGFVRIKREHQVLAVPSISLINPTGVQESSVFVVENGSIVRLRRVKVGVIAEGMTQILDGLREGDQVVAVGQLDLKDGDRVRIGDEFNEIKPKVAGELH